MAEMRFIHFHGQEIGLHSAKLLWIPSVKLLCAADIHLEKGSFFSRFATLLPPYDVQETLQSLIKWIHHFEPDIFIALGDSFHDVAAGSRMEPENREKLLHAISRVNRWIWIMGNHDPSIDENIPGERRRAFESNGLIFTHEMDEADMRPQISGHFHPKATLYIKKRRISAPCFLVGENTFILPSFGAFTGGLDVNSEELVKRVSVKTRKIYLAFRQEIYSF